MDPVIATSPRYFWLSFADPDRPVGQQFLGVSIVTIDEADVRAAEGVVPAHAVAHADVAAAGRKAWQTGCNPGGQVAAVEFDPVHLPPDTPLHRLMQKPELVERGLVSPNDGTSRKGKRRTRRQRVPR